MASPPPHIAEGPLSQLRDIHLPAPLSAWPPAPGWFILAGLVLLAVGGIAWWLYRRWKDNRYRRESMAELQALFDAYGKADDSAAYLVDYAALLKRIALTRYPRDAVAHLSGEAWVAFLDKTAKTEEFSMGAGQALIDANYRPGGTADIDVQALHDLAKHWIKRHRVQTRESVT